MIPSGYLCIKLPTFSSKILKYFGLLISLSQPNQNVNSNESEYNCFKITWQNIWVQGQKHFEMIFVIDIAE